MSENAEYLIQEILKNLHKLDVAELTSIIEILNNNKRFIDRSRKRPDPVEILAVKGLYYVKNALTHEEELRYVQYMDSDDFQQYMKPIGGTNQGPPPKKIPRLVAYFGKNYNVKKARFDEASAPPITPPIKELADLGQRILPRPPRIDGTLWQYDQVVLNKYIV